ncbi:MAG: MGMT family protein [Erysipelotrichaceae bacterium]|nr:MGMT family protein [Erysipelotrichaceae bacterium]
MDKDLMYLVYGIVMEIPRGKVSTYGQIARLASRPKNSRLIGKILRYASLYGDFPCHRVVNSVGRLAPDFDLQRTLLEQENVTFKKNGCVDLKKHLWEV